MLELKFTGLDMVLKRFDNIKWNGMCISGFWRIANGGYDKWFELYYNDIPVAECINGIISSNCSYVSDEDKETLLNKIKNIYNHLKIEV